MAGRIVVVGSVNTDLVTYAQRLPAPGETLLAEGFLVLPGGKGANQAVAASRLGASVTLVGRVGDDPFGRQRLDGLAAEGIDISGIGISPGVPSGIATIVVEPSGENRILLVAGSNALVRPEDIDDALLAAADLVVLQLEIPLDTVASVIARCPGKVLLNPAPAQPLDPAMLAGLAFLVPNQAELAGLTRRPTDRMDDVVAAARRLVRQGVGTVITTLGADGAMLVTRGRVAHIEAPVVQAVDTTGAGDAFIGCFAQTYAETADVDAAVARAVRYAAFTVTRHGGQASYPTATEWAAPKELHA
jgi:ribokinase